MHEDGYTLVEDVTGPGDPADRHHLVDYQTQELLSRLWTDYMARCRVVQGPSTVVQAMRSASYTFDNEAFAGDELQRGIRMASRTRRSCTFDVALWHKADGRIVQRGSISTVFIEPGHGSVTIPDAWWAAAEAMEGKTIAVTERPA
jgi:acyl-CoA thioesterase FadM